MSLAPHLTPKPLCVGPVQPRLYLTVAISGDNALGSFILTSPASVYYSDCWAESVPANITGEHTILSINGMNGRTAVESVNTNSGSWSGWLNATAVPTYCYFGDLDVQQFDVGYQEVASSAQCAPAGQCTLTVSVNGAGQVSGANVGLNVLDCVPSVRLTAHPNDGFAFEQWTGAVQTTEQSVSVFLSGDQYVTATFVPLPPPGGGECEGRLLNPGEDCSPIVINFGRGNYRLTGANSPVFFDIAASGSPARIGWTAAGADEAFLWLDRNHNGVVDNGAELFGNATPQMDGKRAPNGFEALKVFDTNNDRIIDEHDSIWRQLLLWRDLNHDGVSQSSEITSVIGSGFIAISLDYHRTGRRDVFGNMFRYQSQVWIRHAGGQATPEPVYDIFFVPVPVP